MRHGAKKNEKAPGPRTAPSMPRPLRCLAASLIALALTSGCSCDMEIGSLDDAAAPDADTGPGVIDAGSRDAGPSDAGPSDAGPTACGDDLDCPSATVCLGGLCQGDPCGTGSPCEGDDRCRAVCVGLVDPCDGVECESDETCVDGACFPGCLPVACEGVSCPEGQFCDPARGACADISPCGASCGTSEACHLTCTPRSSCEGVTCEEGEFCRSGECLENPCFGVTCEAGEVCQNGTCVETCDCDPACVPPERCIANECVCTPRCAADAACGAPDGCGGFCVGPCEGASEECNPDTGLCECIPSCSDDAACGDSDGCGGLCPGACPDGRACVAGVCTCTDACLPAGMVDCGTDIPDTCMGGTSCPGEGTRCDGSADCIDGSCCPGCVGRGTVACGVPIPDAVDADGAVCRDCSNVGRSCPAGLDCIDPPGGSDPTDRVCCDSCPAASSVPCGMEIPDVLDADGSVCRVCSGFGTAGCAGGESCTGGSGGMCCDRCPSAGSVACGEPIPDPPCRDCSGFGRDCPSGTDCRVPVGMSGDASRVCCDRCPGRSSVDCGVDIPDVMVDGVVCRTCSTGRRCPSGSTCLGGACCPACPSPSGVACGEDIPDRVDSEGSVCRSCGEGTMCAGGTTCRGGSCCPDCPDPSGVSCGTTPTSPAGCAACAEGTMCAPGASCRSGACCTPTCSAPSTRPCGDRPSDGCGGTCSPGTACEGVGETCGGSPLSCECTPSCEGRACGEADGCGGECIGSCDAGFVCAERPAPADPGDFECEPSSCLPSCGLCESCILGSCEPLVCAPGETSCFATCECCAPGQTCTPTGCSDFG